MLELNQVLLSVLVGIVSAIIYSLRTVVMMDKKLDRIIKHLHIPEK